MLLFLVTESSVLFVNCFSLKSVPYEIDFTSPLFRIPSALKYTLINQRSSTSALV